MQSPRRAIVRSPRLEDPKSTLPQSAGAAIAREPTMDDVLPYLKLLVKKNGSDLFFTAGAAPHIKIEGVILPLKGPELRSNETKALAYGIMN